MKRSGRSPSGVRLPHFNKVFAGELFDHAKHFQLEQRGNDLGWAGALHAFEERIQMYGLVHFEYFQGFARDNAGLGNLPI